MKKTISLATLALSASASFALIAPPGADAQMQRKSYCLDVYQDYQGGMTAGSCDQTSNNAARADVGANGCREGQVSISTYKTAREREFPIQIHPCMPPNAAQL